MSQKAGYEGIVILGLPRSGSTLLRRIVNAHPSICCPPETNLLSAASRFLEQHETSQGLSVGVLSGLSFSGYEEDQVLERLRTLVFGFFEEIRQKSGKNRWAEKTAFDSFHLEGIKRLCGSRCRYVCLFRHGLDAVCSIQELCDKLEVYLPELHEYVARYPSPLLAFAHAWADVNEELLELVETLEHQAIKVRYEDLVANPIEEVGRIFHFLEEPTDVQAVLTSAIQSQDSVGFGDWKTYQKTRIESSSVGRWKELHPQTASDLAPIVNPLMRRLGYEEIPEILGDSEEDARRKLELGLMIANLRAPERDIDE